MQALQALPETDRLVTEGIRQGLHLGGQIYVSHGGAIVADTGFGEVEPGRPFADLDLMLWLSSGKPVTAVAIAQLWEEGALTPDDPVADHIQGFEQGGKGAISIRHLLTHTSGIRMFDVGWPASSWEETLGRILARRLEPRWKPGRKAGYHAASSWFVLGEIVQRASGLPFSQYVRERIFEPLEMTRSWIGVSQGRLGDVLRELAPMYDTETQPPVVQPWNLQAWLEHPSPGAGACGPVRELGRFYEMLAGGGSLSGQRLLRQQTVEALTARHRVGMLDQTFKHHLDWGLGLILDSSHYGQDTVPYGYGPHASQRTYGHSGDRSSTAFVDPECSLVVALAVNGMPSADTHRQRFNDVLGAIYTDLGLVQPPESA